MQKSYDFIKKTAVEEGFSLCGVAPVHPVEGYASHVQAWVDKGYNASMAWMNRNGEVRANPALLVEGARTIIVCAFSYADRDIVQPSDAKVAAYALAEDYHTTIKASLGRMLEKIRAHFGGELSGRVFADSAPLLERYWAREAGLGWIGRSGMLINREQGSYLLLGEIVIDRELDRYDEPSSFNGCGDCHRCVLHCPGGAINDDRTIDCGKCISYLTIEQKEPIDAPTNGWIYGCDICIKVCPWNRRHLQGGRSAEAEQYLFSRAEWLAMEPTFFKERFGATPLFRTGLDKIKSSVRVELR